MGVPRVDAWRRTCCLGAYRRRDNGSVRDDIEAAYERFPVLGERRRQPAGLLSGGEQQMLAIAGALVARPRFLLLDEPSLGLAPNLSAEIFAAIRRLADEGIPILLVEQRAAQALAIADRAYVLSTGIRHRERAGVPAGRQFRGEGRLPGRVTERRGPDEEREVAGRRPAGPLTRPLKSPARQVDVVGTGASRSHHVALWERASCASRSPSAS